MTRLKQLCDWRRAWPGALIGLLVLVAYLPSLGGAFLWDDDSNVTKREALRSLHGLWQIWFQPGATQQYYPLTHTTFWLDYHLWGLHPLPYHLENVLLHACSGVLLWAVLRRLRVAGAWLGAALFALHPVNVESVAWITERKNTLSGVMFLVSILAAVKFWRLDEVGQCVSPASPQVVPAEGRRNACPTLEKLPEGRITGWPAGPWRAYGLALLFYLFALWSKTSTVALPVVIGLLLWWKRRGPGKRDFLLLAPFVAVGMAAGLMTMWVERTNLGATGTEWAGVTRLERFLIAGRALWFYLGKLLWPHPLMFMYPRWHMDASQWLAYVPLLAAVIGLALLWRGRDGRARPALVALAYFVILLFPLLGFFNGVFFLYSFVCDHFQYLASIGPLALGAAAITVAVQRVTAGETDVLRVVQTVLLLVVGLLTWAQTGVYRDGESLWRDTLAHNPASWMAHDNLGTILSNSGRFEEAREHYQRAVELRPTDHMAWNNLGLNAAQLGHLDEAVKDFTKALDIYPRYALGHFNLGRALASQGGFDEAIRHFTTSLELDPDYAPAHFSLANALERTGKLDEAIEQQLKTLELEPNFAPAHANLGRLLAAKGNLDGAISHYRMALEIDPNSVDALANLGNALLAQRKYVEATAAYRAALRLNPASPVLHHNLGVALERQGKHDESQSELAEEQRLKSGAPAPRPPVTAAP